MVPPEVRKNIIFQPLIFQGRTVIQWSNSSDFATKLCDKILRTPATPDVTMHHSFRSEASPGSLEMVDHFTIGIRRFLRFSSKRAFI